MIDKDGLMIARGTTLLHLFLTEETLRAAITVLRCDGRSRCRLLSSRCSAHHSKAASSGSPLRPLTIRRFSVQVVPVNSSSLCFFFIQLFPIITGIRDSVNRLFQCLWFHDKAVLIIASRLQGMIHIGKLYPKPVIVGGGVCHKYSIRFRIVCPDTDIMAVRVPP